MTNWHPKKDTQQLESFGKCKPKTTKIFFIPSGITVIKTKKLTIVTLGKDSKKLKSSSTAGEMNSDISTLGSCFGRLFYIYTFMWPSNFTPKYTAKENKTYTHKNLY